MIFQGGFEINLDHRKLKTPQAKLFTVPSEALAIAVATEWDSQQDTIKFYTMHLVISSHTYTPMSAVGFLGTWQKLGDSYPNYSKALGNGCCLTCLLECAKHSPHWPGHLYSPAQSSVLAGGLLLCAQADVPRYLLSCLTFMQLDFVPSAAQCNVCILG